MTKRPLPEPRNDLDRQLLGIIERDGWAVIVIPPEGDVPGWAFTMGLFHTFERPEIVMFGLPPQTMHELVNIAAELSREDDGFAPGSRTDGIAQGLTCELRAVSKRWYELLGYATWLYAGTEFPALQCTWPDKHGKLPHEEGFDPELVWRQPALEHDDVEAARVGPLLSSSE